MVGYGCYRTGHSACGPSSISWSLRAHVWCGCEEVVPQWMIFPMVVQTILECIDSVRLYY